MSRVNDDEILLLWHAMRAFRYGWAQLSQPHRPTRCGQHPGRDLRLGPESGHQRDGGQIGHDDEAAAPRQERILQACRMMCWLSTVMSFSLTVRSTDSGMLRSGREAVIGS